MSSTCSDRVLEPANQGFDESAIRLGLRVPAVPDALLPSERKALPGTRWQALLSKFRPGVQSSNICGPGQNSCGVTDVEILRNEHDRLLGGPGIE